MPPPARTLTARDFFSKRGILSRWHPHYEYRPGQLEMAEAVESAIADGRHLIVEAGTGTGKTLAYLIPAILSGKRVVVSTGTKNLQEQLFYKDIPFLQKHFERPLRVCYMKGRNNYACRQKIYNAEKQAILTGLEEVADFQVIREWEQTTKTGDRAEIKRLPESSSLWAKLDARRELCAGQTCEQFERCFLTLMHQRAHASDIIIVNHHLFFADLALREGEYGSLIPDYACVILDEAHEIEDVAGQYFGISVSNLQFHELRRDVLAIARRHNLGSADLDVALAILEQRTNEFFSLFGDVEGRSGFRRHDEFLERHQREYDDLQRALSVVGATLELVEGGPEELIPLTGRVADLSGRLRFWMEDVRKSFVYWIERRGRGCHLQATPINVATVLENRLFEPLDSVVLTSATLAVAGDFMYTQKRLGLRSARTLAVAGQ
ncbi:MAG: ATP-dependent DNA helicase, partial [Acidobacteria bacterium]|nr:ATP-dependent DNA helicase [Acidobacteriota bacterium]